MPDSASESEVAGHFTWLRREGAMVQIVLYSPEDVTRYGDLRAHGVLGDGRDSVLFVLGRNSTGQVPEPGDLLPFLEAHRSDPPWCVCAFGRKEGPRAQWLPWP